VCANRGGHGRRLPCQRLLLRDEGFSARGRSGARNGYRFPPTRTCDARYGGVGLQDPNIRTNPDLQH
jgi:hypothetical protein